ncbi:MAG: putative glycoside hydrolase [bacterium]|nr:putative glycoside hydrolase [bacterium]
MMRFLRDDGSTRTSTVIVGAFSILILIVLVVWFLPLGVIKYAQNSATAILSIATTSPTTILATSTEPEFVVRHVPTPKAVKAIYMSSWAAGSEKFRTHLFDLVETTEINAVMIDVKDYSGRISFEVDDPTINATGAVEKRITDIKELIDRLHDKNVYVIARISSFQDSFLINVHPEWAVKTTDGKIWQDYKGVKWLDAGAKPVWDYLVAIGNAAYAVGFDELNFDYIRFPSDGNLKDISYTWSEGKERHQVMEEFFKYIHTSFSKTGIPTSADLFGLTTSAEGDLGIGQILEHALKYFDYVAPMVYPSHYGKGYDGFAKPAEHPYEIIASSMGDAVKKATATTTRNKMLGVDPIASTTPQLYTKETHNIQKLRPWLQAFDLGAIYTPAMVRQQIQATYDTGLTSWMLWNAGSIYKKDALQPRLR